MESPRSWTGRAVSVGKQSRRLYLKQVTQDPDVAQLTLNEAIETLTRALKRLPQLAAQLEKPKPVARLARGPQPVVWRLVLDEVEDTGVQLRPRLPFGRRATGARPLSGKGVQPLSQIVEPLELDAMTVADDPSFLDRLAQQRNLPQFIKWS